MYKCKTCGKEFESGQKLGGHITSTHKDVGYKIRKAVTLERVIVRKQCPKCGKEFEIERKTNKNGTQRINKNEKSFCSRSCANTRTHSEETKNKIRESCSGTLSNSWKGGISFKTKECLSCHKKIPLKNTSGLCKKCYDIKNKQPYDKRSYKHQCRFKFNPKDYPEKFDLNLLEEHGWYKPINYCTPNLKGVSMDHMYSINDGYYNKVDPEIISHPANCKIMLHGDNNSKDKKSSITLKELKERIKNW